MSAYASISARETSRGRAFQAFRSERVFGKQTKPIDTQMSRNSFRIICISIKRHEKKESARRFGGKCVSSSASFINRQFDIMQITFLAPCALPAGSPCTYRGGDFSFVREPIPPKVIFIPQSERIIFIICFHRCPPRAPVMVAPRPHSAEPRYIHSLRPAINANMIMNSSEKILIFLESCFSFGLRAQRNGVRERFGGAKR